MNIIQTEIQEILKTSGFNIQIRRNKLNALFYTLNFEINNSDFLPPAGILSCILDYLINKLNYFFYFFHFNFTYPKKKIILYKDKELIFEYLSLIIDCPFLWKEKKVLLFIHSNNFLENVFFGEEKESENTIISLKVCAFFGDAILWKKAITELKKKLVLFGFKNVLFFLHFCLSKNLKNSCPKKNKDKKLVFANDNDNKNKIEFLLHKFSKEKIFELSIHTNYSTLDGISQIKKYLKEAKEKDYSSLGITDHYNVQSFLEAFPEEKKTDIKLIYGCEMEMIDDQAFDYFFSQEKIFIENIKKKIGKEKIGDLVYCFVDLETTGLFSEFNEIVEIGYIIWKKGITIKKDSFLIKPKREINQKMVENWFHKTISIEDIKKGENLEDILLIIRKTWKDCILVVHNASFDYTFLNQAWNNFFFENFPFPILDTLTLSHLLFERKNYSLEKLGNKKIIQLHRALSDCELLQDLFSQILNEFIKKKIIFWNDVDILFEKEKNSVFSKKRGKKVKILVKNQKGLQNLYDLVTLSHTERLSKVPVIFRSDIEKKREGLLIGGSGGREGELFSIFSSFSTKKTKKEKLLFYDFLEVNSPNSLLFMTIDGQFTEKNLQELSTNIFFFSEELSIPIISSHNVHYSEKKEKILKEIILANKAMNGGYHYLTYILTKNLKEDCFFLLPDQHLLSKEEMIKEWSFLNSNRIEKLLFLNPKILVKQIDNIIIQPKELEYPIKKEDEEELIEEFERKADLLFSSKRPNFIKERMEKEWELIKKRFSYLFWVSWKLTKKAREDKALAGSRGSVGCSFIAFLLGITEINPLPFYKQCKNCFFFQLMNIKTNYSCYDAQEKEICPKCNNYHLTVNGFNLPLETFFGIETEPKTPDIDLNFSGEYQKDIHDFVRNLVGKENVHRIGTVNKIKEMTAENFWKEYVVLKESFSCTSGKKFNEEEIYRHWLERENRTNQNQEENKSLRKEILKGIEEIKRTTGQHPGGLIIVPSGINIQKFTPLNYPSDKKTDNTTTHFEYKFLAKFLMKVDLLGHDEQTVLQELFRLTKKDPMTISFNDPDLMNIFTNADTLGVTEFGTGFAQKILLTLKPTKFSHLIQACGFAHGTNIWQGNQLDFYLKKELKLEELMACRDDIWDLLKINGLNTKDSYIITEFVRKGEMHKMPENLKFLLENTLSKNEKGKKHLQIIQKIKYIIPKAHAIAYTITAWRSAHYKMYFPKQFYSVLLTYHIVNYDIWLMNLDLETIKFRLTKLIDNIPIYKSSLKELISINKVLKKIVKEVDELKETLEELKIEELIKTKKRRDDFILTAKEKNLLNGLKIFIELKKRNFDFKKGIDLNKSEDKLFKIDNETIYFPFFSIFSFGKVVVKEVLNLRKNEKITQRNWKEQLKNILNSSQIEQLCCLEEFNLLIWS